MKKLIRSMLVLLIVLCLGCATQGQGGSKAGSSAPASTGSSNGKMLTDSDYKRIGVNETYENR